MRRQDSLRMTAIALLEQVASCSNHQQILQVLVAYVVDQWDLRLTCIGLNDIS